MCVCCCYSHARNSSAVQPTKYVNMSVEAIIEVCQSTGGGGGVLQGSRDRAVRWREGECCQELSHTYVIDISSLRLYCTFLICSDRTFALLQKPYLGQPLVEIYALLDAHLTSDSSNKSLPYTLVSSDKRQLHCIVNSYNG